MENYPIKSVTFGGFDKQDVISYIEKAAQQASAAQQQLQEENDRLRTQLEELTHKNNALLIQLDAMTIQKEDLEEKLAAESAARAELEPYKALEDQVASLEAEIARLQPDAKCYVQFRERIGAIECEARERADDLEKATIGQLQKTVELFRDQYQTLMSTFETTAAHVTSELHKVEVNLSQLPRAMDRPGAELNELAKQLKQSQKENNE